jgi:uncharacterized cupin superfamily protein
MTVVHWDGVDPARRTKGEIDASWQRLGAAAGSVGVGVSRVRVEPGKLPTPPHSHGASEEHYFVLDGSGLAWQDDDAYEVRDGHYVLHRANEHEHTFRAGDDGLEYLVYGTNHASEYAWLPRSRAIRLSWPWVEGRDDNPWDVEATLEPLAFNVRDERPPNILHLDDVEAVGEDADRWKPLGETAGSRQAGLHWEQLGPGAIGAPPHCHSEEEEVFVILEGEGTLELWPTPVMEARGAKREDIPLRAGHLVARPPGTKIAHAIRAGESGLTLLVYGTRKPNDICYYPRSGKIYWRGIGFIGRLEPLDYSDGEPPD